MEELPTLKQKWIDLLYIHKGRIIHSDYCILIIPLTFFGIYVFTIPNPYPSTSPTETSENISLLIATGLLTLLKVVISYFFISLTLKRFRDKGLYDKFTIPYFLSWFACIALGFIFQEYLTIFIALTIPHTIFYIHNVYFQNPFLSTERKDNKYGPYDPHGLFGGIF
ncbi:MAG: hypothetical protein AAF549_04970 [Pseudomonadota bacterium]